MISRKGSGVLRSDWIEPRDGKLTLNVRMYFSIEREGSCSGIRFPGGAE